MDPALTAHLLERWHAGDKAALAALIERDLPWIRDYVSRRLGPVLRARGETQDYVQDAMIEVLRYGPRFVVADTRQFRALVARIVENVLRDQHDLHTAKKRGGGRVEALPSESVLRLDAAADSVTRPSEAAARDEMRAWMRLALELLEPDDRQVILLREFEGLQFDAIGERLGIGMTGARMRFARAIPRLADRMKQLRAGRLGEALAASEGGT